MVSRNDRLALERYVSGADEAWGRALGVVLCGSYNRPDQWIAPQRVWKEIVLANLQQI